MRLDKTRGLRNALLAAAVALLLALTLFLPSATTSAYAAEPYSFEIENFDATYEVHSDRTIDVEERVTIRYTGYASTGFYRDLPVNAGDRVTGLTVSRLSRDGTAEIDEDYSVDIDNDLIIADIGDSTIKTDTTETYVIRYVFSVTKPTNDNALYLNIIGFGSEAAIRSASATINLPEGFESANLYVGDTDEKSNELMTVDGRTITVELSGLAAFEGATLDMYFSEGALTTRFDVIPYIMAIVGCALLAVLAVVKFLVFPDKTLSPVVGFEPPRGMDPVEISNSGLMAIGDLDEDLEWNTSALTASYRKAMNDENAEIFNPEPSKPAEGEDIQDTGALDEAQANCIINLKKLTLNINTKDEATGAPNKHLRKYIQDVVFKYVEPMIPSTTILEYTFDNEKPNPNAVITPDAVGRFTSIVAGHAAMNNSNENTTIWMEYPTPI